jgi:hypothetical protein
MLRNMIDRVWAPLETSSVGYNLDSTGSGQGQAARFYELSNEYLVL